MRGLDAAEVALVSQAGFEGLEASRRKRVESHLGRLLRAVSAHGWILGLFDADRDLLAFEASKPGVDQRTALTFLCMVPLPASPAPVSLKATSPGDEKLPAVGTAVALDAKRSLALILVRPQDSEHTWSESAVAIQYGAGQIAEEIAALSQPKEQPAAGATGPQGFFLLTPQLEVELAWHPHDTASIALARLVQPRARRLPLFLERPIRRLTSSWNFSRIGTCDAGTAYPIRGLSLRVVPMRGNEVFIGTFLDRHVDDSPVAAAASAFRVSHRELEVLHALLDGRTIAEIAAELSLAESTVNDHIARMIAKTNSRNRIEMAATLLGWPSMRPQTRPAHATADALSTEPAPPEETDANPRGRVSWRYPIAANFPPQEPKV
jgi:DNA-binding CsgD family transcriptional regulator